MLYGDTEKRDCFRVTISDARTCLAVAYKLSRGLTPDLHFFVHSFLRNLFHVSDGLIFCKLF